MKQIIQRGAEAVIIRSGNTVVKDRIPKSYRHPELDQKIRKRRTKSEAKLLEKASKIIKCPLPIETTTKEIKIPYIEGKKLSDHLENLPYKKICKDIGKSIAALHDADIIHGDLTTSNMILAEDGLYFIDFGLGYVSSRIEDKAVDLHLIKQALEAKHFSIYQDCIAAIISAYKPKQQALILSQLKKVEARGRYKKGS